MIWPGITIMAMKETMKNLYTGESLYGEVTLAGYETLVLKTEERA